MAKEVLVTGAGGFIGSHLTEALVRAGYQVQALVHYNSSNSWGWLSQLPIEIKQALSVTQGDIRDAEQMRSLSQGKELIFHLAALIAIPYSYQASRSYIETNVTGTLNILHAGLANDCRVLHTSTSEVYGTALYVPIDEKHPLQGQSPYSASKIAADMLAESFYRSFELPVTIVRPFNTFGPRQSARAVIPTILSQLLSDKETLELGALSPTRDLNYVANTVSAYLTVAESGLGNGEVINFGSGHEIAIGDLAELLMKLTGIHKPLVSTAERQRPSGSEVERLLCDPNKAKNIFNWESQYSLEQGLELTIPWLRDNLHIYRPESYTV